ncbi:MAG: hypothetical protein ACM3UM_00015 [Nitrososphaerales archaeon]
MRLAPLSFGKRILQLLGAFSSVLLLLVLAELVLRMLPIIDGARRATPSSTFASARLVPGHAYTWSLGWDLRHVVHGRINGSGFPAPYEYVPNQPALALFGDSFAEGIMLDYRESLAGRLNDVSDGRVRSFNFGISGAALPHYLGMAREMRRRFAFDAALIVVSENDYVEGFNAQEGLYSWGDDAKGDLVKLVPATRPGILMRIARASALFRYLRYHLKFNPPTLFSGKGQPACVPAQLDARDRLRLAGYVDALQRALALAPDRIVIAFAAGSEQVYARVDRPREARTANTCPSRDALAQSELRSLAAARGLKILDIPALLEKHYRQYRQRMDFSPVDAHWNGVATALIAGEASALLKTDRLAGAPSP